MVKFHIKSSLIRGLSSLHLLDLGIIYLWTRAVRVKVAAALEVLSDVLLVLIPLLLSELSHFVLQLDDGPLNFVVLTD